MALLFYRVHHACLFTGADTKLLRKTRVWSTPICDYNVNWSWPSVRDPQIIDMITAGTVYINPEFDIINIECISPAHVSIRDDRVYFFLHQLKKLDSHDIGITNLAGDDRCMQFIAGNRDTVRSPPSEARQACRKILENIRQVYFVSLHQAGRSFRGSHMPLPKIRRTGRCRGERRRLFYHWDRNRSLPMFPSVCTFDDLPTDPRPIEDDLKRVHFQPFEHVFMVRNWQRAMHQLNIQHLEGQVDYRHLLAYKRLAPGSPGGVSVWENAKKWVEEEDRAWNTEQREERKTIRGAYGRFPLENAEELHSQPETVIGFWLFPMEAIDSLRYLWQRPGPAWRPWGDRLSEKNTEVCGINRYDVSQHPPSLAIANLS